MPAAHVSIEFDARGPNNTVTCRDASALLALAEAVNVLERDAADCVIVGGCGSLLAPVDLVKLGLFEELSPTACRPFDRRRDGTVLGEGAAVFVVERTEHARRSGANVYAEVLGVGAGCDGSGRPGVGLVRAVSAALRQAGLQPGELGHVNAHGKGTRVDDRVEAQALQKILGETTVPVTALKGGLGHADAGSGAVELAASLFSLRHGVVPATLNHAEADPDCRLHIVREPTTARLPTALSVNRTSQSQSAAVVVRAVG
jgi:3-oxoacyl-[acyl-carrier-protein] synthase II